MKVGYGILSAFINRQRRGNGNLLGKTVQLSILGAVLWFLGASILVNGSAQSSSQVDVYLPFSTQDYPGRLEAFQRYLNHRQLDQIRLISADHWHHYQYGLRSGRTGIFLAPPHFAAWAQQHHAFVAWKRISTPISYVIAARRSDDEIFEINDLADLPVCSLKPLNLEYLLINQVFDRPLLSAEIVIVPSVAEELQNPSSTCRGFALSDVLFEQIANRYPERYIRLQQSRHYNNYVWMVAPSVIHSHQELLDRFAAALNAERGRQILKPLLDQLTQKIAWANARPEDYPPDYANSLSRYW